MVIVLYGASGCSDYAPQDDIYPKPFSWRDLLNDVAFKRTEYGQCVMNGMEMMAYPLEFQR